jgi:hypothetical protein
VAPTAPSPRPLGDDGDRIAIPPLDGSDPIVRSLVRAISGNPTVAAWLATDGLIRNFVVVVANIAQGATPAKHLTPLRPSSAFRVVDRGGKSYVDPRSYDRYGAITDAVGSVDPGRAARLYGTLRPRLEEAFGELGSQDPEFDHALEGAIVALLRTPIAVDDAVWVRPKGGIGYAFGDERLEALSPAQKQLLRMGPRNARLIQERLREIALALGIGQEALPPAAPK